MKIDKKAQGRRNKRVGAQFENDFRRKMIEKGWILSKWHNNIDLQTDEIVQARNHYIPKRGLTMGKGFPDFVMFRKLEKDYEVRFVECKTNNTLSKEEKMKMEVLRKMGHKCYIAFLDGKEVKYREFLGYDNKT